MSQNLTIPRGKLFFGKFSDNGQIEKWFDLGNCPETVFSPKLNSVRNYDSINGRLVTDDIIHTGVELTCRIVTDDLGSTNLTLWGNYEANEELTSTGRVTIVKSEPVENFILFDNIPNGVIRVSDQSGRTWVNGIDYSYDEYMNGIHILNKAYLVTTVELRISYFSFSIRKTSLITGKLKPLEGELRFVSYNPIGPRWKYKFFRVILSPSQHHLLIGDPTNMDWSKLEIGVEVLQKEGEKSLYAVDSSRMAVLSWNNRVLVNNKNKGFYTFI